jgi:hypothetical protein
MDHERDAALPGEESIQKIDDVTVAAAIDPADWSCPDPRQIVDFDGVVLEG